MRRTQIYLDDQLWNALSLRARLQKTTMSDLVREAVREKYLGAHEERMKAIRDFVGIRMSDSSKVSAVAEVRKLRSGNRLKRIRAMS